MVRSGRLNKMVERCLLVMDDCVTHQTPMIRRWLAKGPSRHAHLTPTRSSRLNQVQRFFALLSDKNDQARRLSQSSRPQSRRRSFIERHNANPKPFRWTSASLTALGLLASDQCRQVHMSAAPELHSFRGGALSTA